MLRVPSLEQLEKIQLACDNVIRPALTLRLGAGGLRVPVIVAQFGILFPRVCPPTWGKSMSSNVVQLPTGPHWRVLIAHQRSVVRHALRTMIESEDTAVVEVPDGEAALAELAFARFDLLILELDLPEQDGVTVMQMHRVLLAHQRNRTEPPAIIFALAPEVRRNDTLAEYLNRLGVAAIIDDDPRSEVAQLVDTTLQSHTERFLTRKPAMA